MTKTKAIKSYCFDCAGESNKEVSLCPAVDCPLWVFRTGAKAGTKMYLSRMSTAKKNYPEEYKEFAEATGSARLSQLSSSKQRSVEKKNG